MSTIITKNSANSGSQPSSLIQGELAINVTDGKLFYGSGSGNIVKEFTGSGGGAVVPSLQQVVNVGNSLVNFGGIGTASLLSVNFVNNRSLYLNDDSYPTIRLVDNNNASNNLQIDIDTISLDGVSYNWSDIVNSTASYALQALSASYAETSSYAPDYLPLTGGTISGNLYQLGTFYPDQIDWFSSSIGYNTGSYILTTTINGLTTYANYQDVANTLAPYIPTVSSSVSASYATTASYIQNAQTASYALQSVSSSFATTASYVSSNFQYEIHVSQIDGNDTTGDGSLLKPVATITKALTLVIAQRRVIVLHPGGYTENPTVSSENVTIQTTELTGGNTVLYGTLTIGTAGSGARISGFSMNNLAITGTAQAYVSNCTVNNQVTKSSSGYVEIINSELQCISGIQISGAGITIINGNKNVAVSVSNASAQVIIKGCNSVVTPSASAGNLAIVDCIVTALGGNGITITGVSTTLTLLNSQVLVTAGNNVAPISVAGIYSIINTVYDKPGSSLTGISTNSIDYFQYIDADNVNTKGLSVTGSITVSGSVINNLTASYAISASQALSTSYATTASYALNGGVTQLLAGSNVILSPTNGLGQVTISSTGGGGGTGNTATGSYGSFYDTTIQTNVASTARSMSLNTTDITNGVSISGSTNPYNTYIKVANAGVYDIQFSAQVDKTDSGTDEIWIWIRKNGTDIPDSATSVQLQGNGAHYVAAWNFFVNAAAGDYFQLMWYSPDVNVRLHAESAFGVVPGIPSLIVTANRVDQFLSNTGSFSGSFTGNLIGTASYATQALSASYAPAGNPFPYNGNAQISGSLGVTGSFTVQTYDAFISNAFVNAVQITDTNRILYDIFGNTSIDAGGRILTDMNALPSANWMARTLFDSSPSPSINWNNRLAIDSLNNNSIDWNQRELLDSGGAAVVSWNYLTQSQAVDINSYTRKTIPLIPTTETFSNLPVYGTFQPDGEILSGVNFDGSVADFNLVYLNTDNKWYPVDVTTNSSSKLLGIAWGVGSGKEKVLLEGTMVVNDSALTDSPQVIGVDHGLPIYIKTGTGTYMSTSAPGTSGNYVRVLGHAYYQGVGDANYWVMKFRPANDWYVI
jgi:hypothetical protein